LPRYANALLSEIIIMPLSFGHLSLVAAHKAFVISEQGEELLSHGPSKVSLKRSSEV
jgi:hypothetical protein